MPTYTYECCACHESFDRTMSLSERKSPQVCRCGGEGKMTVGMPSFVLQGDGWAGKNIKIRGQMESKNRKLSGKSRDLPGQRMVPNVGGEEVDTWSEAKRMAVSKGKDTSGYDTMIRKENAK